MKKGFTLAEVLITLGIIGVVAAMTLPNLSTNLQKAQAGPGLMTAMNTLEQVNMKLLHDKDARNLLSACNIDRGSIAGIQTKYLNCISPYLSANSINLGANVPYYVDTNRTVIEMGNSLVLKNGVVLGRPNSATFSYDGKSTTYPKFYIDINGYAKGPNTMSIDVFSIMINPNTGKVFATGSDSFVADIRETSGQNVWGTSIDSISNWRNGCPDNVKTTYREICTGSIVDHGGKVMYEW